MKIFKYEISNFSDVQIENFKCYVDKKTNIISPQTAIAHYFIKKYISDMQGIPVSQINFSYNKHGKPYYNNKIHFSISHSKDIIFIAIDNKNIGIDVESIRDINPKIIGKVMTKRENDTIENSIDFLRLWTIKEAYFKLIGTGITKPDMIDTSSIKDEFNVNTEITDKYILSIVY